MRVISVPLRLRVATALLVLCVPVAAIETIVVTRAPWWKLPYSTMQIWCAAVALICLPLAGWMAAGKRWGLSLTAIFAAVWCVLSAWVAIRNRNPSLGFFTLFLTAYWVAVIAWIRHEMGRSFFDPRLAWYQGLPKPIPALTCELVQGGARAEARVSRLDEDGVFLFLPPGIPALAPLQKAQPVELAFRYRDREVRCRGLPVCALAADAGAGFQFQGLTPDTRKQLADFVEMLRGEGHV
jgi:hypothetical protein